MKNKELIIYKLKKLHIVMGDTSYDIKVDAPNGIKVGSRVTADTVKKWITRIQNSKISNDHLLYILTAANAVWQLTDPITNQWILCKCNELWKAIKKRRLKYPSSI